MQNSNRTLLIDYCTFRIHIYFKEENERDKEIYMECIAWGQVIRYSMITLIIECVYEVLQ